MPLRAITFLFWLTFLSAPVSLMAHGDLHERILALTQSIQTNSANVELFFKRGELQRLHGEPLLAIADFKHALALDPALDLASLGLARSSLDAGKPSEARPLLDSFLNKHPGDSEALLVRARTFVKLGQHRAAAADYSRALQAHSAPLPDIYLERASVLAEGNSIDDAISSLDDGLSRLGHTAPLQLRAIDLELARKRPDAALRRLDSLLERAPRKEFLLCRRASILEDSGRAEEARQAYLAARAALQTLPPERQSIPAVQDLAARIRAALIRLPSAASKTVAATANP